MNDEVRKSMTVKIKPSVQRAARHAAIDSEKKLSQWLEEAIEEKIEREEKKAK